MIERRKLVFPVSFKPMWLIGFGYWKDIYRQSVQGCDGEMHRILVPFFRIEWGYIQIDKPATNEVA